MGVRSPVRASNREFLTLLHAEMQANRKVTRELLSHLRDSRAVNQEILALVQLVRQDIAGARISAASPPRCKRCDHVLTGHVPLRGAEPASVICEHAVGIDDEMCGCPGTSPEIVRAG